MTCFSYRRLSCWVFLFSSHVYALKIMNENDEFYFTVNVDTSWFASWRQVRSLVPESWQITWLRAGLYLLSTQILLVLCFSGFSRVVTCSKRTCRSIVYLKRELWKWFAFFDHCTTALTRLAELLHWPSLHILLQLNVYYILCNIVRFLQM